MEEDFGDVVSSFEIGKSYMGVPIIAYAFAIVSDDENRYVALHDRPSLMINAAHHPRELTTISFCVYIMIRLLHGYVHEKELYTNFLRDKAIFFVPMVNIDGVKYISDEFDSRLEFPLIRKNRHIYWD